MREFFEISKFQSRNRDTSDFKFVANINTCYFSFQFQSRNRDTSDFKENQEGAYIQHCQEFQSRNRDTSDFKLIGLPLVTTAFIVSIS